MKLQKTRTMRTVAVALTIAGVSTVGAAASQTAYADSNVATSTATATHRGAATTAQQAAANPCGYYWEDRDRSYWTNCAYIKEWIRVYDYKGERWKKCIDPQTTASLGITVVRAEWDGYC
jgi:hypothetical protein